MFRRPWDRPRREATADRQLLAVVARYSLDLVHPHTEKFYLRTDMAAIRLVAADMVGMEAVDRGRGAAEDRDREAAVDPATAMSQLAHQKQRTVPVD
jgi:hypothetical protein